jgi:hypothetical protein
MRSAVVVRLVGTEPRPFTPKLSPVDSTRVRSAVSLGLIAALGLASAAFTASWSHGIGSMDGRMKRDASRVCQSFVKHRIKTPSKAHFSGYHSANVVAQANRYTVSGQVTLPNSAQYAYSCTVHPANGRWILDALDGLG